MLEMFEELELSVCALGQDGGAEGLHDLLDGDILVGELIAGRAAHDNPESVFRTCSNALRAQESVKTYQTRPNAPMPTGCRSEYLR